MESEVTRSVRNFNEVSVFSNISLLRNVQERVNRACVMHITDFFKTVNVKIIKSQISTSFSALLI
jgi:hypothetical protein